METTTLLISQIRIDGGTQSRAELNQSVIEEYAEAMRAGAVFPPLVVFYDGTDYWLADGFHRIAAAGGAELDRVAVEIRQGTREDAQWHSYGANQYHGLRRSNADKQRAVRATLIHPNSQGKSDREIARHVGVDHKTVGAARSTGGEIPHPRKRAEVKPQPEELNKPERQAPRTYHPGRSTVGTPEVPELPDDEPPIEGIAGAIELIMASKRINRVRLTPNERRYLMADKAGLQIMREAWKSLGDELQMAEAAEFSEVA